MDNKNCIASVPDCIKELSQLKSQIYTLELKLKNLGLEDLEDVTYCLNPKIGDSLVYNGNKWVAKKVSGSGGGSTVEVESLLSTGNPIAKITVDGEEHTILESSNGGGTGNLDNVKVNNITGTVNNKIAEVTVTGNDINLSTFEEPDKTNEELEIESSDKVTEALAKLQKALKDDEAAVTQALMSIQEASGFNENLSYIPIEGVNTNHPEWNIIAPEASPAPNISLVLEQIISVINNTNQIINNIKNYTLTFTGGIKVLKGRSTFSVGDQQYNEFKIEVAPTVIENITKKLPKESGYYSISDIISETYRESIQNVTSLTNGSIITFEYANGKWAGYQYVGPTVNGAIEKSGWEVLTNWYKIWDMEN